MTYKREARRVYFIKPVGMAGPIKIGVSASPDGRRCTLQTWSPFPLEIIAEIEGGADLEARFHIQFSDQHRGREWFDVTAHLLFTIEQINAGTFDIDSLPIKGPFSRLRKRRDLSFLTSAWRYNRSVHSRMTNIVRNVPGGWSQGWDMAPEIPHLDTLSDEELEAIKPAVEKIIDDFRQAVAALPTHPSACGRSA